MKSKKMKSLVFGLAIFLSFFLGRESKDLNMVKEMKSQYVSDTFEVQSFSVNPTLNLSDSTTVYRCGKSKIYHPTTRHSSFKRCKSKVSKLTVKQAKSLGMRHCKCSG